MQHSKVTRVEQEKKHMLIDIGSLLRKALREELLCVDE